MRLPITIGKTSNDDVFEVDLIELPHLFISYSEKETLYDYYREVVQCLSYNGNKIQFAVMAGADLFNSLPILPGQYSFIHITKEAEGNTSRNTFTKSLFKELSYRKRQGLPAEQYAPLIVLVEDIFDWMINQKKSTTLFFLELLLEGKNVNIHLVGASIRTYRNLLTQLLNITEHPKIRMLLKHEIYISEPLGAELIINSEELFFYKGKSDVDYTRYFHINEGQELQTVLN